MKSESYTQTILRAEEGMKLTEASPDTPIEKRTIASIIALGVNDSADRYIEISDAQAAEYEAQLEALRKEQAARERKARHVGPAPDASDAVASESSEPIDVTDDAQEI